MSAEETIAGLKSERELYLSRGLVDRAKAVEAELAARGVAVPQGRHAPDTETAAPKRRTRKG